MALQGNQVVNILVNGSPATIEYSAITGKFTFNLPAGAKGDRGDAFTVNAIGTFAQRTLYDNQVAGFSFLALDVEVDGSTIPHIYFKKSATSGDWSTGIPFGRGEKGDVGISIVSIQFVSTTDASGLEGVSGAIDTYRFLLSDGTYTNTFVKYNGADIQLVNDLITQDDTKALTAYQGFILKGMIDNINTLIASDDTTLDQLQEIVDFIKLNREDLQNLSISNIAGLVDALASKINIASIVDALTSTDATKVLSANQGKILKDLVDLKQPLLESGVNIKTINGIDLTGSGDVVITTSTKYFDLESKFKGL